MGTKVSRYSKLFLTALILILVAISAFPAPVYAIADPDTPPSINAVYVYEDLLEDGDVGILIEYFLDYAAPPTETATEAYLTVFIDTDGTTQLRAVSPYTYQNSGYDGGLTWIYFSAADVVTHSIDSANELLYRVWLVGNPTLAWAGDPPKTVAGIDYWMPVDSDASVLLALRVLAYADQFELAWILDLIQTTSLGNRLTTVGEDYFENVIADLRVMAPNAFPVTAYDPIYEDIDYDTVYGCIVTGAVVVGTPVTIPEGVATAVNITGAGTVTLTLELGTVGTVAGAIIVEGTPLPLVAGVNTITTSGAGVITVTANLVNTQTTITDTVTGTGLDLSLIATRFGMSRMMFSGLIWLVISVLICAAVYRVNDRGEGFAGGGKVMMLVFNLCIIGGAVLGLMSVLVAALLFIGFGAFTAYVLFFRGASA